MSKSKKAKAAAATMAVGSIVAYYPGTGETHQAAIVTAVIDATTVNVCHFTPEGDARAALGVSLRQSDDEPEGNWVDWPPSDADETDAPQS